MAAMSWVELARCVGHATTPKQLLKAGCAQPARYGIVVRDERMDARYRYQRLAG